jgi:GNAT superfamily N-acetyltransferase
VRFREAEYADRAAIANLHSESWRAAYRGAYRDELLDGDVARDRLAVWEQRLSEPPANQFVVLAEEEDQLLGFACAYGRDDARWGTLLDNLHVQLRSYRQGTGALLVSQVTEWCRTHYSDCGLYLWVLVQNERARRFYERLGATDRGGEVSVPPGGGQITGQRYAWTTLEEITISHPD